MFFASLFSRICVIMEKYKNKKQKIWETEKF